MIFANVFPKGAATLLRIAILGLSATGIFAAGYAPASADMQGWWNV